MAESFEFTPVLFTNRLIETASFYKRLLGFQVKLRDHGLHMERDGMVITYRCEGDYVNSLGLSAVLRAKNIRELHREYLNRGVPVISGIKTNFREPLYFLVTDLNGCNVIFRGQAPNLKLHRGGLSKGTGGSDQV